MTNNDSQDPRLIETRRQVFNASLKILLNQGVSKVTYANISKATGISRSTLYRHWSTIEKLRMDMFMHFATPSKTAPKTNGPLREDLLWLFGILISALNDTPWKKIAPQVITSASTDKQARATLNQWMKERFIGVEKIFTAAAERGELEPKIAIAEIVELAVAVPYFRKLVLDFPLDKNWLNQHVDLLCLLALKKK